MSDRKRTDRARRSPLERSLFYGWLVLLAVAITLSGVMYYSGYDKGYILVVIGAPALVVTSIVLIVMVVLAATRGRRSAQAGPTGVHVRRSKSLSGAHRMRR